MNRKIKTLDKHNIIKKILCISDTTDPIVYSNSIKTRFKDVDLVLSAGDLDLDYYNFIVSNLNKPLLFVFGNHKIQKIYKYHKNCDFNLNNNIGFCDDNSDGAIHVGGKIKKIDGLIIAGLGGSMRYNKGYNQYTELGMMFRCIKMIPKLLLNKLIYGRYLDILLTHAPPRGIHDKPDRCHQGFKVFLWFMDIFKPRYLIHGHIHLYDMNDLRISKYKDTQIINAYSNIVIKI